MLLPLPTDQPAASETDVAFMHKAIEAARRAGARGEVPVGAVVVKDGCIISAGFNEREAAHDPTAHAEILALRAAAQHLQSWRLCDADLYVTLEPCPMCAGALVNARVRRVIYGCDDPKAGAARTLYRLLEDPRLNHRVEVVPGVLADDCAALLKTFFAELRTARAAAVPR